MPFFQVIRGPFRASLRLYNYWISTSLHSNYKSCRLASNSPVQLVNSKYSQSLLVTPHSMSLYFGILKDSRDMYTHFVLPSTTTCFMDPSCSQLMKAADVLLASSFWYLNNQCNVSIIHITQLTATQIVQHEQYTQETDFSNPVGSLKCYSLQRFTSFCFSKWELQQC